MSMDIQVLPIGATSTLNFLEQNLGSETCITNAIPGCPGISRYMLVKTMNATSIANGRPVLWNSILTRTVTGAAAAASQPRGLVAGVAVLSDIQRPFVATALAATNTYFWVCLEGPAWVNALTGAPAGQGVPLATQADGNLGVTAAAAFDTNIAIATGVGVGAGTIVLMSLEQ
jgi:hypothetical protein